MIDVEALIKENARLRERLRRMNRKYDALWEKHVGKGMPAEAAGFFKRGKKIARWADEIGESK